MENIPAPPVPPQVRTISEGFPLFGGKEKCSGHTHKAPDGTLVKCYHACKNVLTSPAFWIGSTLSFPIEHALWTKLPILKGIATWAGL